MSENVENVRKFFNETVEGNVAADHAAPCSVYRDFLTCMLQNTPEAFGQGIWFQLPEHLYVQFLVNCSDQDSRQDLGVANAGPPIAGFIAVL